MLARCGHILCFYCMADFALVLNLARFRTSRRFQLTPFVPFVLDMSGNGFGIGISANRASVRDRTFCGNIGLIHFAAVPRMRC